MITKECPRCDGTGKVENGGILGSVITCPRCGGSGRD